MSPRRRSDLDESDVRVRANPRGWPGARQQGLRVAKDEVGDHRSSITEASRVEGVESPQPGI